MWLAGERGHRHDLILKVLQWYLTWPHHLATIAAPQLLTTLSQARYSNQKPTCLVGVEVGGGLNLEKLQQQMNKCVIDEYSE